MIGRQKGSGAPNGYNGEFDTVNLDIKGPDGTPLVDVDAHIRLVSPDRLGGIKILRRGYNFTDGSDDSATWTRDCSSSHSCETR